MVASCSTNDKGKSQSKNLGSAGRWELAIGRSVSGTGSAAVARLGSMGCPAEWTVILSETKDVCIAAGTNHLQRSFAAHRMTRFGKISTVFLQEQLTSVIVRTCTRLYVQLWRRDAATTTGGTGAVHLGTLLRG